jgi:hypothetical protein
LPAVTTRYRCFACGNLTRFDIVTSRRTRAFHHFTVGGELQVEDEVVLEESVDEITCRWCGTGASVEAIDDGPGTRRGEALEALPMGAAVAQRPGAEGAESGDDASFDLSAAKSPRGQP